MVRYRTRRSTFTEVKDESGWWQTIALIALVAGLLFGVFFAAELWDARAQEPRPTPDTIERIVGTPLPSVVATSKVPMAGTMKIPVDMPTLDARSRTDVPDK
jgi:hypothetical protein